MKQWSAFLLVLISSPLLAKGPNSDQRKAINDAEVLGSVIYAQDHAASVASDVFLAATTPDQRKEVTGWLVIDEKDSEVVTFVGTRDGKYVGLYQVGVKKDRPGSMALIDPPRELEGSALGMFSARQVALKAMPRTCSNPYNTVVLPGGLAHFDGWLVYLLAATSEENVVPVGGHYRAHVTSDGTRLISIEPLSKSCLTLPRSTERGPVAALYMTHIMTDTPIETHVFLNLVYGVDFYVATESSVWSISKGSIRYVGRNDARK